LNWSDRITSFLRRQTVTLSSSKGRTLLILLLLFAAFSFTDLSAYYYGQNKVNPSYTGWSQIETKHFDIYFPAGNDEFGKLAALLSEETYYYLKRDFQFPAISRIPIIFYGSQLEFQTTNIIYPLLSEGIGGFTESLKNRVAIPFDGSYARLEQIITHELTHAYINALDTGTPGSFFYLRNYNFPFWFTEGLPEYEAVGGEDINNKAYIMDLVINDKIRSLNEVSGYSAYRLGESFLVFLNKRYGRDKVMDYFYTLRALSDPDKAAKKVFGMEFKDLETRWINQLKRDFYPYVTSHTIPEEYSEVKSKHKEDASYFNLAPRFSPDGQKYVYFSNRDGRFSIWTGGLFESDKNRKLITGEATGNMEEFHYLRTTLAWFPDNRRFAFVAKTSMGDKIYIADFAKAEITEQITIPELKVIYEIDISPDGESCVLSGQKSMKTDIYLYGFSSQQLTPLTDDNYFDYQPRFAPDGKSVAFASERTHVAENFRKGYFSDLRSNIFMIGLSIGVISQITNDDFNCSYPVWDSTGTKLIFISERDSVPNLEIIDIVTSQRATVTKTLSSIYSFDLNQNDSYLVYSCYYNGGWDIYLKYSQCADPRIIEPVDSLFSGIDFSRLDFFGKRPYKRAVTDGGPTMYNKGATVIDFHPERDTVIVKRDYTWDDEPDSVTVIPRIKPYRVRYSLDRLWGGFAYTSSVGTIGSLELGLSDVMGNNAIGINLGMSGKIKDSNILLSYLYLPYRIDYGIGFYNILDEVIYKFSNLEGYYRYRDRQTGLYFLLRYPLNKFLRLDFEQQFYTWESHWDWHSGAVNDNWQTDIQPVKTDMIYTPAVTLVQDNALYGPTGPLLGWRAFVSLRKSLALHGNDYQTAYLDLRSYTLFSKRYSMAMRIVGGASGGKQPQTFNLNGYYGIRGFDSDMEGERISMASAELRFPFMDYFSMAFPLPITISSLRGSVFADIGSVWNGYDFRGMREERLQDLKMGYGFGPRLNIGFAVLKFDIAWLTDLVSNSKPTYYFSLTEDF
jgi:Tol biopolymer transport system component